MNRFISYFIFTFALGVVPNVALAEVPADVLFARKIQPLFKIKCLTCHGDDPEKPKGDLDMRTRAGLLKGGESEEPALVPGKAMASPIYLAVTRAHEDDWSAMPPKQQWHKRSVEHKEAFFFFARPPLDFGSS